MMFTPRQLERIEPSESWRTPCRLVVGDDRVDGTCLDASEALVVLAVQHQPLTERARHKLVDVLAGMWHAFPVVEPELDGCIEVPLVEPAQIRELAAIWRVTPELEVVHEGLERVWLRFTGTGDPAARLDADGCWALLRALVSVSAWQDRLREAFVQGAIACHVAARRGPGAPHEPAAVFAGETTRRMTLNDPQQLPCRISVSDGEADGTLVPGEELVLDLKLSWRSSKEERRMLGMLLSRLCAVLPADWHVEGGYVDVPYVHPTRGDASGLVWSVADDLSVVYGGHGRVWFTGNGDVEGGEAPPHEGTFRRSFDVEGIRRLVQVMASLDGWEDDLEGLFERTAETRRVERIALATCARAGIAEGQMVHERRDAVRLERYDVLVAEFNPAMDLDVPECLPRFVLLEGGRGRLEGGVWHEFGDDVRELLRRACETEEASWWPPFLLVDLDSSERFEVAWQTYSEPLWTTPGIQAEVIYRGRVIRAHS